MTQTPQMSSVQPKPKLRWFQYSMRTLLFVMLLVCCGLGWLIHDVREQEAVVKMIEQNGGHVEFGEPSFLGSVEVVRSLFGEHAFTPVTRCGLLGPGTTNEHILQIRKLKELQSLWIVETQITTLSPLAGLKGLNNFSLFSTNVSDLSPLAGLTELESIMIFDTPITDLSPLAGLRALTNLELSRTHVTDLSPLARLSALELLNLEGTPVSDLSPLSGLNMLKGLDLSGTSVSDLSPLAGLPNLKVIVLRENQEVQIPDSLSKVIRRF